MKRTKMRDIGNPTRSSPVFVDDERHNPSKDCDISQCPTIPLELMLDVLSFCCQILNIFVSFHWQVTRKTLLLQLRARYHPARRDPSRLYY